MKYRSISLLTSTTFLLIALLVSSQHHIPKAWGVSESEALSAIDRAEEEILAGYEAVVEADEVGANIKSSLATLIKAGELLSKAELSLREGDYDSASLFASQSRDKLAGFVEDVKALTENAMIENNSDFIINIVGSTLGTISILCGGIALWYVLKRKGVGSKGFEEHR